MVTLPVNALLGWGAGLGFMEVGLAVKVFASLTNNWSAVLLALVLGASGTRDTGGMFGPHKVGEQ